jgi:two-component system sensor histidine kinase MtrB
VIRRAVRAWKRLYWRIRPRLPLRTKVSVFFGLLALVAGVSLTVVTYTIARSSLLDERVADAKQRALSTAFRINTRIRAEQADTLLELLDPEETGFSHVTLNDGSVTASDLNSVDAFPGELLAFVEGGESGLQRFEFNGNHYLGIGIHLAEFDANYYEAFPLRSIERTLRTLLIAFSIGSATTVALASSIGVWTSRRLMRPLTRITDAATQIASGDLDTRVAPEHDRDLEPLVNSFNGMADAVQTRIQREERFASDVSHELRSPITALSAATEVLERRRDDVPDRTRQAIDVIVTQVRRFDRMVLDLLELSRIDAGVADVHEEPAEIAALCQRIARRFGFEHVPISVDPTAPVTVSTDRVRFERILGNLLDNARHHAGDPTRISIEPAPEPFVDVVVEDDGPGVLESERTRIFERFARGSESLYRVGTGLGLALVSEHAHVMGGEVWVEDRPGGGSRFVVRLRRGDASDESEESTA